MSDFEIKAAYAPEIHWSSRGSCGNPGCTDPECRCALCQQPIGVSEDDPRWSEHDEEYCGDDNCELCRDQVPIICFRGEGHLMQQASFHTKCFEQIVIFSKATVN